MNKNIHQKTLLEYKLKITPQRIAVLEAITELRNHPTAENIKEYIKSKHPNIALGTIYKTLETFVDKGIVKKVKTEKDFVRYDAILENHHHLYCAETEHIEDYFDKGLNKVIHNYFQKKNIPNFIVEDVKLQIIGKFTGKKTKSR